MLSAQQNLAMMVNKIFDIDKIPDKFEGMDAGPKSLEILKEVILNSKTILWNGPVGVFEFSNYSNGTNC